MADERPNMREQYEAQDVRRMIGATARLTSMRIALQAAEIAYSGNGLIVTEMRKDVGNALNRYKKLVPREYDEEGLLLTRNCHKIEILEKQLSDK